MSFFSKLFQGEPAPDQKEVLKNWNRQLGRKIRDIERDVEAIKREEGKITMELKKGAKANMSKTSLNALARTLVKGRNTRDRLLTSITQIKSVTYELEHMAAQIRVAKILGTSTNLLQMMRSMMPYSAVRDTCIAMSKEMFKAGLIEETIDDAMALTDGDDLEDLANEEVDNVLSGILNDMMAKGELKDRSLLQKKEEVKEDTSLEDDMIAKLANLG